MSLSISIPIPIHTFNAKSFHHSDDVKRAVPVLFRSCKTNRKILTKYNSLISVENDVYYGLFVKSHNSYKPSNDGNRKAVLFLSVDCVNRLNEYEEEKVNNNAQSQSQPIVNDNDNDNERLPLPPLLQLEDHEHFKDNDGKTMTIEARGVREHEGVFFKAIDVEKAFEMPNLVDVVLKKPSYTSDHYQIFVKISKYTHGVESEQSVRTDWNMVYLTYEGMLKVLYCSKSKQVKRFRTWATRVLFAAHMGDDEQKNEVIAEMKGLPMDAVSKLFSAHATTFPVVYLISLGKASDLRTSSDMFCIPEDIAEDAMICKYGYTEDICSRVKQHSRGLGRIPGVALDMKKYAYIDPTNVSKAETDLRDFFKFQKMGLESRDGKQKELVLIPVGLWRSVEKEFESVQLLYAGRTREINLRMENLEQKMRHQSEVHKLEMDKIEMEKRLEIAIRDEKIAYRDLQIQMLRQ